MPRKPKSATAEPEIVTAFKGFNADLTCRGFQYEVGKTYKHGGPVVRCAEGGFHACEMPLDVWGYYGPATSVFATVELGGDIARAPNEDSKVAAAQITIKAELRLPDFIRRAAEWVVARAKDNLAIGDYGHAASTGDYGHAASTGDYGHAASTGDYGHAASTGDRGHAASTGDYGHAASTGYCGHAASTGDRGHAAVEGENAVATSVGRDGTAKAVAGSAITLATYGDDGKLVAVFASMVGQNGIEEGVTYRLRADGKPEKVGAAE